MKPKLMRGAVFFLTLVISACSYAQSDCQIDNPALQAMPKIEVTLTRDDGSSYSMPAKLADNNTTRAAGFQRVCESTIEAMPILFVFQRQSVPSFHMNNVVAPLDIAFIDKEGGLESIQATSPYSVIQIKKPLYSPKRPVLYALEVHKGFYQKHEISVDSKMTWAPSASLSD
jgi:uncharacterized membrane protein (UPF0127 family)